MKATSTLIAAIMGAFALSGCVFGGNDRTETRVVEDIAGGANPYLWRATLDTFSDMPLVSADPLGGVVIYDWRSFEGAADERIKATVYILDSRLRADGVKVSIFRQTRNGAEWADAATSGDTAIQLENAILVRARNLKAAEID